jgi:methyltransferase (TIGR00027 family)
LTPLASGSDTPAVVETPAENPVSATAYWTLAARYADATSARSVANDTFAERFMNDEARAIAHRFRSQRRASASFPVRHRVIDELVAAELERRPSSLVLVVGAGFDARAFRLRGGRWVEVDEPALLTYKESRLPAGEAPNELVRVPVRFAQESLAEALAPYASEERVVIVLEGVLGYLGEGPRTELVDTLGALFPRQLVVCDLTTRTFLARYGRRLMAMLRDAGADFASSDTPEAVFLERGYRAVERLSIPQRGAELGASGAPSKLLVRLLPSLRDGYCVWAFVRE